jgi:hypothetical protein
MVVCFTHLYISLTNETHIKVDNLHRYLNNRSECNIVVVVVFILNNHIPRRSAIHGELC